MLPLGLTGGWGRSKCVRCSIQPRRPPDKNGAGSTAREQASEGFCTECRVAGWVGASQAIKAETKDTTLRCIQLARLPRDDANVALPAACEGRSLASSRRVCAAAHMPPHAVDCCWFGLPQAATAARELLLMRLAAAAA